MVAPSRGDPPIGRRIGPDKPVDLPKGAEMGRFLLGSTVVLLWPKGTLKFNPDWVPGGAVRMGQAMGKALG